MVGPRRSRGTRRSGRRGNGSGGLGHVNRQLRSDIHEEQSDKKKYEQQASELDKLGRHEDAESLRHIAAQEEHHSQIEEGIIKNPDPASGEKWAQEAFNPEHRGELRAYVKREYGKEGFVGSDEDHGTIKKEVLHELQHSENPHVRGMAQGALNINE
jgi:hypothetical protein